MAMRLQCTRPIYENFYRQSIERASEGQNFRHSSSHKADSST